MSNEDYPGMNTELLEDVIAFVAEFCQEPKSRLSPETSINDEMGMDGDDGTEFLQAFSVRFGVDLSAFPRNKYFGPEAAANPISIIEGIIRRVTTGRCSDLAPLTLRHLADAVENGPRNRKGKGFPQ